MWLGKQTGVRSWSFVYLVRDLGFIQGSSETIRVPLSRQAKNA